MKNFSLTFGAAAIFVIWYSLSALAALPVLPSPVLVLKNIADIFAGSIAVHCVASLTRIFFGVALAVAVGLPAGMLMGYRKTVDRLASPFVYFAYPVPKIALLPVLMLLLGTGDASKVLMIFLIIVFQVIVSVRDGVRSIPKEALHPLFSLGATPLVVVREALLPASLPKLLTAIRVALATAISVLFFTETYGTTYGMGYFIMDAWLRVNYIEMYSGIVVMSLIGIALFASVDFLEKKFCRWAFL